MGVSQPKMRNLFREFLLAKCKKVKSECFAALNASVTKGKLACPFCCTQRENELRFAFGR